MSEIRPGTPQAPETPSRLRLRRSRRDRIIGGVCGGLAAELDVDPVIIRIAAVALALSGGLGVLAYVLAWMMIPEVADGEAEAPAPRANRHAVAVTAGACLVGVGAVMLLRQWLPGFGAGMFWPLVLVAAGVLVLVSARR